jgi:diaminopimelate epimerase
MKLHLYKMQGCGNDFLFLDAMNSGEARLRPHEVVYLCDRNYGVGADGLAVLSKSSVADASWTFYNSDGSIAEMCGNAARCAMRYLGDRYFPGEDVIALETKAGVIKGRKLNAGLIEVTLTGQKNFTPEYTETILEVPSGVLQVYNLNTGVPHAVIEVKDIYTYPIARVGREVQAHALYAKEGTNVTFFQRTVSKRIRATTFERGVEAETLACGTGAAAAAVIFSQLYMESLPIDVTVPGGELIVDLSPVSRVLLLRGSAEYVFEVDIEEIPASFERTLPFEQIKKRGTSDV